MKILIVTQYFWPEYFKINDLAQELTLRGHEITVLTGIPNYPKGEFYEGYNLGGPYKELYGKVKVIRMPIISRGKGRGIRLMLNYFSFGFVGCALAPFLVKEKHDRIFCFLPSPVFGALPAITLGFLWKSPVVTWLTDLWPETLIATNVLKNKYLLKPINLIVKFIYRHSNLVMTTSKGVLERIASTGVHREKLFYCPQWAEDLFENYRPSPEGYNDPLFPQDGFRLLFAGNLGTAQDLPTLLKAAHALRDQKEIKFVFIGDGVMKEWCQDEVQRLSLQETVFFLDKKPIELIPYYYANSDALLISLCSTDLFTITIPGKLQTCLAGGKPIVASLDGEGSDIINEWKAGVTSPAGKPELLAQVIRKLAGTSTKELEQMGKNSLACYQSEFRRDEVITIMEKKIIDLN